MRVSAGEMGRGSYFPRIGGKVGEEVLAVLDYGSVMWGSHPHVVRVGEKIFLVLPMGGRIPLEETYWNGDNCVCWRDGRRLLFFRAYNALKKMESDGEEWVLAWKK